MSLDEHIRTIVNDELSKRQPGELVTAEEFCKKKNVCRTTLWRAEKKGEVKLVRIGRKIFVNTSQFHAA